MLAGGRAEARGPLWGRLKSAPPSKRSPASGGPKWLTLFPRASRNCGRHQESRDSSRPSSRAASTVPARREESRRRRHECLRHVMAQVNFPNYPKSPADIGSSENIGQASTAFPTSGVIPGQTKNQELTSSFRSAFSSAPSAAGILPLASLVHALFPVLSRVSAIARFRWLRPNRIVPISHTCVAAGHHRCRANPCYTCDLTWH